VLRQQHTCCVADESSIVRHGSLFSGIGGFDLAAGWNGWQNVFQVEIDEFCRKVLEKNFPDTKRYADIKEFDGKEYANTIDVLSGGFPCQPFSVAGKRRGTNDDRYLWHEMLRVIRETKARWVVIENVCGLLTIENGMVFEQMCVDLEAEGYKIQPFIIPACGKGAWHKRDRLWIIANLKSKLNGENITEQSEGQIQQFRKCVGENVMADDESVGRNDECPSEPKDCDGSVGKGGKSKATSIGGFDCEPTKRTWWLFEPSVGRVVYGLSKWLDALRRKRIRALGNAIVPQIVYEIFRAIEYADSSLQHNAS